MVFYNILPNGKHSKDSLELRCMISVVHCKCYVLDSLKCLPHPLSGINQNTFSIQGCLFHLCFVILAGRNKIWWKDAGRWSWRREYRKCRWCYWFRSRFNTTRGDYLLFFYSFIFKTSNSDWKENSLWGPKQHGKVHHLIIHNYLAVMHTTATFCFLHLSLLGDSHMKSIEILIRKKKN